MTHSFATDRRAEYGTAKRLRADGETNGKLVVMSTVLCEQCGARFAVGHRLFFEDAGLAQRQAVWLQDRFVWDHIQEQKHSSSIRLPGAHELSS